MIEITVENGVFGHRVTMRAGTSSARMTTTKAALKCSQKPSRRSSQNSSMAWRPSSSP